MRAEAVVVDASVAFKWFVPEPDSEAALDLARLAAERRVTLHAPDIWVSECANAIWKHATRLRTVGAAAGAHAIRRLAQSPVESASSRELLPAAYAMAVETGVTVYDALYVALAQALDAEFVTADQELIRRIARAPLRMRVRRL